MKSEKVLLFFCLILLSCGKAGGSSAQIPAPVSDLCRFTTGPLLDVSAFPQLTYLVTGIIPPIPKVESERIKMVFSQNLLVYNLKLADWKSGIMLEMQDPPGHIFTETLTPMSGETELLNSRGEKAANLIYYDDISGHHFANPVLEIIIRTLAYSGLWEARLVDPQQGSVISAIQFRVYPQRAVVSREAVLSPFQTVDTLFSKHEKITIIGSGWPANFQLTLALYRDCVGEECSQYNFYPVLICEYAVYVITDDQGMFQTEFISGEDTVPGDYVVVIDRIISPNTYVFPLQHLRFRLQL